MSGKLGTTTTTMKTDATITQDCDALVPLPLPPLSFTSLSNTVPRPPQARVVERLSSEDEIDMLSHPGVMVESMFERTFGDEEEAGEEEEEERSPKQPDAVAKRDSRRFGRLMSMSSGRHSIV